MWAWCIISPSARRPPRQANRWRSRRRRSPDGDEDGDGVPDSADDCPNTPTNYAVDANGCPILIEEIARFELQVNFDFDEFTIRENEIAEIGELPSS